MALAAGSRLGPYEMISAIGAGGMGEVFRARDTKLNRDVAIKVLPAAFAQDDERVARFKREAQVLASLNRMKSGAILVTTAAAVAGRRLYRVPEKGDAPVEANRAAALSILRKPDHPAPVVSTTPTV